LPLPGQPGPPPGWSTAVAAILGIAGFAYLFGISTYGAGEEGQADESTGRQASSPVS